MNGLLNVSARVTKAKDKPWPRLKRILIKKLTKPSEICDGNGIVLRTHLSK